MTTQQDKAIASGAKRVEETEHLTAGLSEPRDVSIEEREPEDGLPGGPVKTHLGELTLTILEQGQGVRVRVGNAHNSSELYEHVFPSSDEAADALLQADILTDDQVPDSTKLAGTSLSLTEVTAEQLEAAGLKRHQISTL